MASKNMNQNPQFETVGIESLPCRIREIEHA